VNNPGPVFTLHDGPPYANGALHVAPRLNKILKDISSTNYAPCSGAGRARVRAGLGLPSACDRAERLLQQSYGQVRKRAALHPIALRRGPTPMPSSRLEVQKAGFQAWGSGPTGGTTPTSPLQEGLRGGPPPDRRLFSGQNGAGGPHLPGLSPWHFGGPSPHRPGEAELDYPDGHTSPSVYVAFPGDRAPEEHGQGVAARWHSSPSSDRSGLAPPGPASLAVGDLDHHPLGPAGQPGVFRERTLDYAILPRQLGPMRGRIGAAANCQHLIRAAALVGRMPANQPLGLRLEPC